MGKVQVTLNGITFEAEEGQNLLKCAGQAGVGVAHLCLGNAICSTCRVKVSDGMASLSPQDIKEKVSLNYHLCFDENTRLACQTKVIGPGPVVAESAGIFRTIRPPDKIKK